LHSISVDIFDAREGANAIWGIGDLRLELYPDLLVILLLDVGLFFYFLVPESELGFIFIHV
jgi:hypothetical protein